MKYYLMILSFTCFSQICCGQIKVSYDEPGDTSVINDTKDEITVVLHVDPRLESILKRHKEESTGSIYTANGFRVQIYSGTDRAKATQQRIAFIKKFPGVRTYMTYIQPQFRVKVGDYRTREDAQKMYHDVGDLCNPCMIVPDIVVINTFKE